MKRSYNELVNLPVGKLVAHAFECTKMGVLYDDLVDALAYCLDLEACGAELCMRELEEKVADAERRAESWREEAMAIQRQLDMVRG